MIATIRTSRRRPFFSHKNNVCAPETYLHRIGKEAFRRTFLRRQRKGERFHVRQRISRLCDHFRQSNSDFPACTLREVQSTDLTKVFDRIDVEVAYGGFIADCLLSSSRHEKVLFIEIDVLHEVEPAKRDSGIPIVEIQLETEDQLRRIQKLDAWLDHVTFYNFEHAFGPSSYCAGNCHSGETVVVFGVSNSEKCFIERMPLSEAHKYITGEYHRRVRHAELLRHKRNKDFLTRPFDESLKWRG